MSDFIRLVLVTILGVAILYLIFVYVARTEFGVEIPDLLEWLR